MNKQETGNNIVYLGRKTSTSAPLYNFYPTSITVVQPKATKTSVTTHSNFRRDITGISKEF